MYKHLPPPNLQGNYYGSCVSCFQGADTGLAFRGEAEWVIAGLMALGIEEGTAPVMVAEHAGTDPGMVPVGVVTLPVRVCSSCAKKAGFKVKQIVFGELPVYEPKSR